MASTTVPSSNSHNAVNPSEVGWQFVPQYYTFVNKEPNRLHCFYNKNSTFIHGTEGEDGKPCYGQQEIHKRITSIGFEDCKVFIHSVDAQASANGGIIVQVIGEMSNKGEPWRKFVQTFFLAEQPNGYFVLNDIFRFLKEESVEDDSSELAENEPAAPVVPEQAPVQVPSVPEPVFEAPREPTPPPVVIPVAEPAPAVSAPVDEAPTNDVTEPAAVQARTPSPEPQQVAPVQTNGIHTPEPETVVPVEPVVPEPVSQPSPVPQQAPQPPAPVQAPQPPVQAPAAPAPAPAAPSAPRSWASLAATNSKKWGAAVATESRGLTETLSVPSSGAQTPVTQTPAPIPAAPRSQGQGQQGSSRGNQEHPAFVAAQAVNSPHCFVKGVTEPVTQVLLQGVLSRFGQIKDLEIVRSKACAFIEYTSAESAKRAIITSLNHNQGGEGGVYVDGGDAGQIRISIETKKERSERAPGGRRGGAPPNANGDGSRGPHQGQGQGQGFRGGRGGGRGRGVPTPK